MIFGRTFGKNKKHRPFPILSPNKTIEGYIGAITGIAAFVWIGQIVMPTFSIVVSTLIGTTIVIAGLIGDLTESWIKRLANVKDSGHLLPGHGGLLDRIDGHLFAMPIFFAVMHFLS